MFTYRAARRDATRRDKKVEDNSTIAACRVGHKNKNKDASVQPEASFEAYDGSSHVSGSIQTNPEYYSDGAIIVGPHVSIDIVTMQSRSQK